MSESVGDYEIVAKLTSGGMATLFLGRRTGAEGFSRHVAIKVVHEHLANDPTFVQMFVDEALLSSRIQHPNVVHVEELREVHGRHFLVMEYVHGCALSSLLGALRGCGRTLGPELATYIAVKVAEGLHAAHETKGADGEPLGVVHRDVTPQNVLLSYRGNVKLIDFGVAKARGRVQQTTGASLKGKVGYMPPEQAFGRSVDRRTDIYALGVVLWEMLTGRRAFVADNDMALLEMVRHPSLPPASSRNAAVPAALDAVIARATAPDADQRFATAQQMRKALAQALPSALALDASDLERLLAATLLDEREAERRRLPESVSGIVSADYGAVPADAERILATLTLSAADLSPEPDSSTETGPSGVRERAEPSSRPTSSKGTPLLSGDAPDPAPGSPSRAWLPWLAVCLGFGLLAVIGGVVAYWQLAAEPTEMRTTELPRTGDPASPVAAEPPGSPPRGSVMAEAVEPAELQPPEVAPTQPPEVALEGPTQARDPADETAADDTADDVASGDDASDDNTASDSAANERRARTRRRAWRRRAEPARPSSEDPSSGVPLADEF